MTADAQAVLVPGTGAIALAVPKPSLFVADEAFARRAHRLRLVRKNGLVSPDSGCASGMILVLVQALFLKSAAAQLS
jgi:hypothetical protein